MADESVNYVPYGAIGAAIGDNVWRWCMKIISHVEP